jgi:protein ImuB
MDSPPTTRMCLYLPFLSTDHVRRIRAAGAPVGPIILTQSSGLAHQVARVDAPGQQAGLRPGMSLAQARALVPGLTALAYDPQRDRIILQKLADWAVRFSPLVETCTPDTLLIDITGCEQLFGGQERIAALALAGLADAGFFARAAIADTVGGAFALATTASQPVSIAPPGQTAAHLAPLPPVALRLQPQTLARLEALGILTIGDLLKLPRATLPARFGAELNLRLQQALGEVFEGVAVRLPRTAPYARMEFEQPIRDLITIQTAAADLLKNVFTQLEQRDQALRRLDILLLFEKRPLRFAIGLARPSRRRQHVRQLLEQGLEKYDFANGLTGLLLIAGDTSRSPILQGELFQPDQQPQQDEQLGLLLDRLANRLGRQSVLRADLVDDYQPEMAVGYSSAASPPEPPHSKPEATPATPAGNSSAPGAKQPANRANRRKARHEPKPVSRVTPLRPTQLLPRPLPIRVISKAPDGPPTWFSCRGREYTVSAAWGPERIETAWWRGPDIRRDYFRLETETGEQFWVYHNFDDQRWYLHGVFA